jgi:TRAP-type C4-dicarboxylate transport system permease small subunit
MTESPTSAAQPAGAGFLERVCDLLAKLSLVAMMLIISAEVVMRNALHYSWEGTDEVASYLVVAVTFLSLASCQGHKGYHELQIVKARLSIRGRAALDATLHLLCLVCALVLLWQFSRLVLNSWSSGDASPTSLRVPFWIPQIVMPIGVTAFCIALVKAILLEIKLIRTASSAA